MEINRIPNQVVQRNIRRRMIGLRADFSGRKEAADLEIFNRVFSLEKKYPADTYFVFVSYGTEVDTIPMIKELISLGKRVYAPKVDGSHMLFYRVKGIEDLTSGFKGILEPDVQKCEVQTPDLFLNTSIRMLVPGLAFDRCGNRIGYGGGFYDRYLETVFSQFPNCGLETWGLGYDFQMVDEIPQNPWDQRLNLIITNQEIIQI